jgi:Pyruvate/2-oxoacid:ferredoxin oxidoreductase delta subunit
MDNVIVNYLPDILKVSGIIIPLIAAIVTWYLNERSKRIFEAYIRKEERYAELIQSLRGFYIGFNSKELKDNFLTQLNLCWMYCPDKVIEKAYAFLHLIHTDVNSSEEERDKAVGEFMLAIREDMLSREQLNETKLKPEDFRILAST